MQKIRIPTIPAEELEKITKESESLTQILRRFGLANKGGNYKTLKRYLKKYNIDFSHIPLGKDAAKIRARNGIGLHNKIPLEKILVKGTDYKSSNLKRRLVKKGILNDICLECGQGPEWNGKKLTLQLDHINGDRFDNRLENLRVLCPNCHTQTKNYAGKVNKIDKRKSKKARERSRKQMILLIERGKMKYTPPLKRPSREELASLLWVKPSTEIAKIYGVSSVAVGKWAKHYGLNKPPRGYWQKQPRNI